MNRRSALPTLSPQARRSAAAILIALCVSMIATVAIGQQIIPFGDVPATTDFSEAEIVWPQLLPNKNFFENSKPAKHFHSK
jgi:hypothetical protein